MITVLNLPSWAFLTLAVVPGGAKNILFILYILFAYAVALRCAIYCRPWSPPPCPPGRHGSRAQSTATNILVLKCSLFFSAHTRLKHANEFHGLTGELTCSCLCLLTVKRIGGMCEGVQQVTQSLMIQTPPMSLCQTQHCHDKQQSSHSTSLHKTRPSNQCQSSCKRLSVCVGADDLLQQLMSPEWVERNFISIDRFAGEVNRPSKI